MKIYPLALGETAEVLCSVDSEPPPRSFNWTFNNSANVDIIKSGDYFSKGSTSVLKWKPVKEFMYGTIMCWGENSMGKQADPCVFNIKQAGELKS